MLPNLFIIGAPKTGSTSLYQYLIQHPQIFMCKDKEPHYFCNDFHEECKLLHGKLVKFKYTTTDKYNTLFNEVSNEKVVGESSTSYLYSSTAAYNIYKYNPDAKIIAILRNPVDLMHSWYNYIKYTSEEPAKTFDEALDAEITRKFSIDNIPKNVWYASRLYYHDLVQFDSQLKRYYDLFNSEQIKIILTDDLKLYPENTYLDILDFLGLDHHMPEFRIFNVYREIKFKKTKALIDNHFYKIKDFIIKRDDLFPYSAVNKIYKMIMSQDSTRPEIDIKTVSRLRHDLLPMVSRTGDMIHRNLIKMWDFQ